MRGLSLVAASGGHSSSQCTGLSLSRPLLLRSTGSRHAGSVIVAHGPSCSTACGIFHRPGLEPVFPALAGRFSTTAPPGKPQCEPFLKSLLNLLQYCFCFICWFFGREACGILAPRPGIEPALPALEGEVPATAPTGKSLHNPLRLAFSTVKTL